MKKRYISVFIITLIIFAFTLWLSNKMANRRLDVLKDLEDQISLNILSTETRFSLLEKTSCEHLTENQDTKIGFNEDLTSLAKRVKFMENQLGSTNENVKSLKEYYALLQIKDYLLNKEFQSRCKEKTISVLYFFDNTCTDCVSQSIILDALSKKYPQIRVYWLDKDIETPALKTIISLFHIKQVPSLIIGENTFSQLQTLEQIESLIPETKIWEKEKQNIATTTEK